MLHDIHEYICVRLADAGGIDKDAVRQALTRPPRLDMGDLAFPCFPLAALRSAAPQAVARALADELAPDFAARGVMCEAAGPYINFRFDHSALATSLMKRVFADPLQGAPAINPHNGKTVVIDYSSPNIAKPFSMGHLRSTSIGNALARMYRAQGWKVARVNHLGDWGTQFGKLIVAFRLWGDHERLRREGIPYLMELYVRVNEEAKAQPSLDDEARAAFKQLEDCAPPVGELRFPRTRSALREDAASMPRAGWNRPDSKGADADADAAFTLWKVFREVSLAEFERIYDLLGVSFDSYAGESFYNDKVEAAIAVLEQAGLVTESEGALVVPMESGRFHPARGTDSKSAERAASSRRASAPCGSALRVRGTPVSPEQSGRTPAPCMIRKRDGASTYAARDLAAIFYRWQEYAFDRLLYVVGAPQTLHFKQVFTVLEKLGLPYAAKCVHIPFGQVLLNGELMSTRKGNVVFLESVIREAEARALEKMRENAENAEDEDSCLSSAPDDRKDALSEDARARARILAVSSIIFYDLKNGRIKDVDFNWEEILNPHGETGVYLQYAHARIYGIMRKYSARMGAPAEDLLSDPPPVTEEESWPIFDAISRFPEKLNSAVEHNEPSIISRYLLDLASVFSTWYRAHKVINENDPALSRERMATALAVRVVLARGMELLGMIPLEKM